MHGKCLTHPNKSTLATKPPGRRMAFLTKADQTEFLPGARETLEQLMAQPTPTPAATVAALRKDQNRADAIRFLEGSIDYPRPSPEEAKILENRDILESNYQNLTNTIAVETKIRKKEHRATDARFAALTKLIKEQKTTSPTPTATVKQRTNTNTTIACPYYLRGNCTDLSCTKAHFKLPDGMTVTNISNRNSPNKRFHSGSRDNGRNNRSRYSDRNRQPPLCWNFNSARGCNYKNCRFRHEPDRKKPLCADCGAPHETKSVHCYKNARAKADQARNVAMLASTPPSCQLCKGAHKATKCPRFLDLSKNE
jgi:hypothetical protein